MTRGRPEKRENNKGKKKDKSKSKNKNLKCFHCHKEGQDISRGTVQIERTMVKKGMERMVMLLLHLRMRAMTQLVSFWLLKLKQTVSGFLILDVHIIYALIKIFLLLIILLMEVRF